MPLTLRVLCWDHPRCTGPMTAAATAYQSVRPDVTVQWSTRLLAQFNDQPVWEVTGQHDLIFVDHPMVGGSALAQALVPLDTVLPAATLRRIADETIGAAHRSYSWGDHQWALGADATSQVAAVRRDRLQELATETPRTWDDVLALAASAPGSVALPLYPSDAMCTLISLSANAGIAASNKPTWLRADAVEMLTELVKLVDPACYELNPPRLLTAMATGTEVGYVPFTFGYANLASRSLTFTDVPGVDGTPRGAILGGAGLAVFPASPHVGEAAEFAAWCMRSDVQRDILLPAGAQPGNRLVWDGDADPSDVAGMNDDAGPSDDATTAAMTYLRATRRSIEHAYVRPRDPWWPPFHRDAGIRLVALLRAGRSPAHIVRELEDLAQRHRDTSEQPAEIQP